MPQGYVISNAPPLLMALLLALLLSLPGQFCLLPSRSSHAWDPLVGTEAFLGAGGHARQGRGAGVMHKGKRKRRTENG